MISSIVISSNSLDFSSALLGSCPGHCFAMNSSVSSGRICFRNQNFCFRTASTPCARFMFLVQCTNSKLYKGSVRDGVYQDFIVIMYSMCVLVCVPHTYLSVHAFVCIYLLVYTSVSERTSGLQCPSEMASDSETKSLIHFRQRR